MNNDDGRLSERLEARLQLRAGHPDWMKESAYADSEETRALLTEALDLARRWEGSVVGTVDRVGCDEEGDPRVLVHSTIDELHRGAPLPYRKVRIVPDPTP